MSDLFFSTHPDLSAKDFVSKALKDIGGERAIEALKQMYLIRHLEARGEAAYQHGLVGGFYHAYSGQEAIQVSAVHALGVSNWWITTYRCHALALLLGATPNEVMAELYGKETGNAKGRGGSMHLFADTLLGGFGIVGGHIPIAAGAAFSAKYLKNNKLAVCFMGDGAVAQGAFHEALNLSSLWDLPAIYVIENNQWGMGTHVDRALCVERIAEMQAPSYRMKGYTLDGMCYFSCYLAFQHIAKEVQQTKRPVLVECVCERFRGHSISDPGLYRSKEELEKAMKRDPLHYLAHILVEHKVLKECDVKAIDKEQKEVVLAAMEFAKESSDPSPATLEEGVYAP
ncbi:MAG: pyruvate dehydrogenase (acetyl-transferring) E1 component subunit alpha [Chlamydiales bacterium]|nr:pyruvate dehydrogenase (acetyl-transferring) E1 component subunit alpha [Chlamydiales bacterium]